MHCEIWLGPRDCEMLQCIIGNRSPLQMNVYVTYRLAERCSFTAFYCYYCILLQLLANCYNEESCNEEICNVEKICTTKAHITGVVDWDDIVSQNHSQFYFPPKRRTPNCRSHIAIPNQLSSYFGWHRIFPRTDVILKKIFWMNALQSLY